MSLLDDAIWWHVYPLGALGAPIHERKGSESGHRLRRLDAWLDYAIELGCSGLLLGPIFDSVSHGYDTLDHFAIDPRLGDADDFDRLVAECRARGLNILLDGVFNHVAASHPDAARLSRRGEDGAVRSREGPGGLTALDHSNSEVADLVAEVMLHWLRRGIAGWRLDVAYEVPPEFWREVTGRVRREFPGVLFLGEMIHGDYSGFVEASGLDTVTQYELWKGTWSSIKDRNFWELAWALDRHAGMCRGFVPQTFIGNHDVTRIASEVGDDGAVLAATALFTLPGMPSVYYGDEQAFQGRKLEGLHADDELRPPLPASPAELSPAGEWMYRIYQRLIGLRRRNPWLSRGRLKVIAKENAWIEYRMSGDAPDQDLRVRLALEPQCSATVMCGGETAFHWER